MNLNICWVRIKKKDNNNNNNGFEMMIFQAKLKYEKLLNNECF